MATERQIAANRENSKKSTGPTSAEGLETSSRNRLSNGFSSNVNVIPGEDPEEFKALIIDFMAQYEPANPTEQVLVEKMAVNQWLGLRAIRLQTNAFCKQMIFKEDKTAVPQDLSLLIRYKTTADNAFHKAHNELVKAQKERKKSEIGFVPQSAPAQPENESKIVPITPPDQTFSEENANPVTPDAPPAPEITKTAA